MTKPSIGLLGANGAGKTTIADYLVAEHGYRKLSFAEPLREFAMLNPTFRAIVDRFGYRQAKDANPEVRQYLIDLGEGIRKYDPVYFVKALASQITDMDPAKPWVVDDVRKQVEVNFLGDMGFRFIHVVKTPPGDEELNAPDLGVDLPTRASVLLTDHGKFGKNWYRSSLRTLLHYADWALGAPIEKEERDGADSPPVLEQPDPDQDGEGLPAEREGGDTPHWCPRCEAEWVRWGNFLPAAVGEARARWHADESRRGRDESERHGSIATLRDGEGDAVRGDSPGSGGVVPLSGDRPRYVYLDRQ